MQKKFFYWLLLGLFLVLFQSCSSTSGKSADALTYLNYPDYPSAHSSWGSICYSKQTDKVIIAVTNHHDSVALFTYNPLDKSLKINGFLQDLGNLNDYEWQGKVHSQMIEASDGWIYFGTDGGEDREEHYMNHVNGYVGGILFKYNPKTEKVVNLGFGKRNESIKTLDLDLVRNRVYAISYPSGNFLVYDIKTSKWSDFGSLNTAHVPRGLFTDKWGNAYYSDIRGHVVMFHAGVDTFIVSDKPLPSYKNTPPFKLRSGLHTYARTESKDTIYTGSDWGTIIQFLPKENELPEIENLGNQYGVDTVYNHNIFSPNLVYSSLTNCLFYNLGGHNHYVTSDSNSVFMKWDLTTNLKTEIQRIPAEKLLEASGCSIVDKRGTVYYAARSRVAIKNHGIDAGESGSSKALFLILDPKHKEISK